MVSGSLALLYSFFTIFLNDFNGSRKMYVTHHHTISGKEAMAVEGEGQLGNLVPWGGVSLHCVGGREQLW